MISWDLTEERKPQEQPPLRILTTEQVCELMQCTRQHLYEVIRCDPTFPATRFGRGYRFDEQRLREWMRGPGYQLAGGWKHDPD